MKKLLDYGIFQYLWLIILMPKAVQFAFFLMLSVLFFLKSGLTLKKDALLIVGFLYVYLLAIIYNVWLHPQLEMERIFAALNVLGMWFFSLIAYGYYSKQEIEFSRIQKYMHTNMLIMIALSLVFLLMRYEQNVVFLGRSLARTDWLATGRTERFNGFLEYPNLITLFYLLALPFALVHIRKKSKRYKAAFIGLSFVPMIASNSRIGLVAMLLAILCFIFYDFFSARLRALFLLLTPFVLLFVFLLFSTQIGETISDFFHLRSGSNTLRFRVYEESLRLVFERSPLIGLGIREAFATSAHLGTHSTYVGIIFRTGILGSVFFFVFFIRKIIQLIRKMRKAGYANYLGFLLYFLIVIIIEDIDGSNWPLFLLFSYLGIAEANPASKGRPDLISSLSLACATPSLAERA